jgi:hypothetical protein
MRIEQPWSRAAWITSRTRSGGVDPQAGGAGLGRFDPALVVEVDVGHERHADGLHDRR